MIPFNKPYLFGTELINISTAAEKGKLSGDGYFTKKCEEHFQSTYGFSSCLLTSSCTAALEMTALLIGITDGDEVILPSYTFVSCANAFALRGANLVFCDSRADHPGMDEALIEELITPKTKAIVVVHYAGVACDMDRIMQLSARYNLYIIEDAAHSVDSYYLTDKTRKALGGIGHFGVFSFHETKNLSCGEGGMLIINDPSFVHRAEIIREKGTNRSQYFRGEIDKYRWVDLGSSYLMSEINAAFLFAQIENTKKIQDERKNTWNLYYRLLEEGERSGMVRRPAIPSYATNNAHIFYLVCRNEEMRNALIKALKKEAVLAVFHYVPLHKSPYYMERCAELHLSNSEYYSDRLLRLPIFYGLKETEVEKIAGIVNRKLGQLAEQTNNAGIVKAP